MVKGYKAMNSDMTCRGFQFEVGKTYETDSISLCSKGFHFCEEFFDVYSYYPKTKDTVVCEVEALGEVQKEGDKSVTNKIRIVRQLSHSELLAKWINQINIGSRNSGYGNSGSRNSGSRNSGDWNSGSRNSGDWNSGDWNSGYGNSGSRNSGDWNSGDWNSGSRNSGDWNSGYGNSGSRNSGDWNSGYGNSGYFNTEVPIYFFNKPSNFKFTEEFQSRVRSINVKPILRWIPESEMTEQEKNENPAHKTTGGFLRKTDRMDWRSLTDDDKVLIKSLPNFDDEVFKKISDGVSLLEDLVEVTVNGKVKKISKEKAKQLGLLEE